MIRSDVHLQCLVNIGCFLIGRGYWPEPSWQIIPYWPELFQPIIPYWPELYRPIISYWPDQIRPIIPVVRTPYSCLPTPSPSSCSWPISSWTRASSISTKVSTVMDCLRSTSSTLLQSSLSEWLSVSGICEMFLLSLNCSPLAPTKCALWDFLDMSGSDLCKGVPHRDLRPEQGHTELLKLGDHHVN